MAIGAGVRKRISSGSPVYYGWFVTGACFAALLSVFSIAFSFGVFFDHIIVDLGRSRADTSLVFSLQTLALYASAGAIGGVVDRYGVRPLLAVGTVLLGVGMLATTQAGSLVGLYVAYGLVAGTGMGIVYVVGYTTVPRWFDRRRGVATAIATLGTGMATLAAPPVASALIARFGWQTTYLVFTTGALAALAVVALVVADDPTELGLDVPGEFPDDDPADRARSAGWREQLRTVAPIVRSPSFVLIFAGWLLVYLPLYAILVHLVTYTTDVGMARWVGVWSLSVVGGMSIPGRVGFGFLGDRVGRTRLFLGLGVLMNLSVFTLPVLEFPAAMLGFAVVYGILYGGTAGLVSPLIADFYGADNVATLYGVGALAFGISSFVGPYAAGKTVEVTGTYDPFFVASAAAGLAGVGLLALAARYERRL